MQGFIERHPRGEIGAETDPPVKIAFPTPATTNADDYARSKDVHSWEQFRRTMAFYREGAEYDRFVPSGVLTVIIRCKPAQVSSFVARNGSWRGVFSLAHSLLHAEPLHR